MFKIPKDLERKTSEKFKNVDVQKLINFLFQEILEKTLLDGSCTIREFGKFIAFSTFSTKLGQNVVRFKFNPTQSLRNKLKTDTFLLESLPVKAKNPFNETNEINCAARKDQRNNNRDAKLQAEKLGKQKTNEKLNEMEIREILLSDD